MLEGNDSVLESMKIMKTYLNIATLLASTPSSNVTESAAELDINNVKGSNGTRIVFSWT